MNAKTESKINEIKKDEIAVRIARKELANLKIDEDVIKNKVVYKMNEVTELESRLVRGYNALSKILVEDKGE
jgi:hypothetical protein